MSPTRRGGERVPLFIRGEQGIECLHVDLSMARQYHEVEPTEEQRTFALARIAEIKIKPGYCFLNAQTIALYHNGGGRLVYAEGRANDWRSGLPALHAWLVLDGRIVVDPTWTHRDGTPVNGTWDRDETNYMGVEFDRLAISRNMTTSGMCTSILHPFAKSKKARRSRRAA